MLCRMVRHNNKLCASCEIQRSYLGNVFMKNQIRLFICLVIFLLLGCVNLTAQIPTSDTFDIPTANGKVTVKNFYKTSGLTTESGAVEMRDDEYQIAFDGLNYYNFFIHLPFIPDNGDIPPGWDFRRSKAEQDFLQIIGISKTDACKLKVNVGFAGVHNELAETYAGINFGLSFCPNSLPIPPLNLSKSKSKTSTTKSTISNQTLPAKIRALLDKSYSGWKLNPGDKICDSKPFVSGDFDGNNKTDYAVMFTSGRKGYIIAFLATATSYKTIILETNSASAMKGSFLSISRKGEEYDQIINENFDRKTHKLKTDAPVSGGCESSAYLYVYNKGKFERAFVSD